MLKYEVTIKHISNRKILPDRKVIYYTRYGQYHRLYGNAIIDAIGKLYYNYYYGVYIDDFFSDLENWHTIQPLIWKKYKKSYY